MEETGLTYISRMHGDYLQLQYRRIRNPRLRSILLHTLFWTVWLARNVFDVIDVWSWDWALIFTGTIFITQAPLVYVHLYWIVPKFLNRSKLLLYLLLTGIMVLFSSWCNFHLLQYLPVNTMPETMQNFILRISWNYNLLENLIVVILTYALKYTLIAFLTQNELLQLQKEKLQLELRSLKAQVHPHFLFNTLNNLYSLTLKNSESAGEMVLKLSDIMRYVLYEANEDQVSLEKEISFIRNYIELQKIRYNERYKIEFQAEGDLSNYQVAPLLFIDFVENAFKHGLDKRFTDGFVHVDFLLNKNYLHFTVINSVGQSDEANQKKNSGIGLQNVRRRLELIYPDKFELNITHNTENYKVHLKLQIA
jgi:sensor histidine kinase YesM